MLIKRRQWHNFTSVWLCSSSTESRVENLKDLLWMYLVVVLPMYRSFVEGIV